MKLYCAKGCGGSGGGTNFVGGVIVDNNEIMMGVIKLKISLYLLVVVLPFSFDLWRNIMNDGIV